MRLKSYNNIMTDKLRVKTELKGVKMRHVPVRRNIKIIIKILKLSKEKEG